jgi:hypothetical protein
MAMGWTNASYSQSLDHLFRPETLRTVMAAAFFCPTMTTSRLPRGGRRLNPMRRAPFRERTESRP